MQSVREGRLVAKEAHESKLVANNKNTCAVVVDGDSTWFNNPQFRITTLGGHGHKAPIVYVNIHTMLHTYLIQK